ncbi:MAG: NAD(P)H-dependent glycerol-3-phosphate dehydrogenase [Aquihabitans sp.]
MNITVIGAGAWGTTIASTLSANGPVTLWAFEPEVVAAVNDDHRNPVYLPDIDLSPDLAATSDLRAATTDADLILMAVPSQHFRSIIEQAAPGIAPETPFLTLTKGIEAGTLLRMSEVAAEVLVDHPRERIGVLSGPNIAREIAHREPAATVVAITDPAIAALLQQALSTPTLRVYTNPDVIGCEIGGAVKNVIALAAGMAEGLGFGQNTLAAIVTRGLAELTRLGLALGGEALTFLGLAGIGDLVVTCHSPASRNHHVGVELGRGRAVDDIIAEMTAVAEGVRSCRPVLDLGARVGVDLPICSVVGAVLSGDLAAADVADALLGRTLTTELHGITSTAPKDEPGT